jgi:hypothetical protein
LKKVVVTTLNVRTKIPLSHTHTHTYTYKKDDDPLSHPPKTVT